jgi:hypothetical protein
MAMMHHGGLPTAVLHGCSPSPYTSVTRNLNLLQKIWSKSIVHSLNPSKDTLKRRIITVPPSTTTTHHDGGLSSPLSYTLTNNDPPLPSMPAQHLRQNLRYRHQFRNGGWTKWAAVQFADELEAKQNMEKAEWDFWKEANKQREALDLQINGPLLFEWDDLSEEALQDVDKCLRQRWNAYKDMAKEMAISSYFGESNKTRASDPSPSCHQV